MILKAIGAVLILIGGAWVWVNFAPINAQTVHRDPAEGADGGASAVVELTLPATTEAALSRLHGVVMHDAKTAMIAGDPSDGRVTYVQRSNLWGFPDIITASAVEDGVGSRLRIWSRSRFGSYDFGVNRARLERWVERITEEPEEGPTEPAPIEEQTERARG
jgi:uncharacterized protein (DUF1499 family)